MRWFVGRERGPRAQPGQGRDEVDWTTLGKHGNARLGCWSVPDRQAH